MVKMKSITTYIFVWIMIVLFAFSGNASDLDEVICNAMKGMQSQEEKKIPYKIDEYDLIELNVNCEEKSLLTQKRHTKLKKAQFADDYKISSVKKWEQANCKNMIFNTNTGWSSTQVITDVNNELVLKLVANFEICTK